MNLLNGVFSKSSAFSKVKADGSSEINHRESRSLNNYSNIPSNSANSSLEARKTFVSSAERYSSSSEREISLNSEYGGS